MSDLAKLTADLQRLGITRPSRVFANLQPPQLVPLALARGEAVLSNTGALVAQTGKRTGRSPGDKFVVRYPGSASHERVWWGKVNQPVDPVVFERLLARVTAYLQGRDLFVLDASVGADDTHALPIRLVTELAWHYLFAYQLFRRLSPDELTKHEPAWTIIAAPRFLADPEIDGTKSETAIMLDIERRIVLICGTEYAGEMKKSIFTVMNYVLPERGVLPMHCSANIGARDDVALFFGLSGTGKTTLSADPNRRLIGDDEHGWGDHGVFNIEGGCYAKCIDLSCEKEPQIWNAVRFGAVVENVVVDPHTGVPNYADGSLTENTRVAYPLEYIENADESGKGGHPKTIIFLTADAFGVLPPIARLTAEQARYHFLSGYTAKAPGTEVGITEPQATFSTCFGAPFLPCPPEVYARMLVEKMSQHHVNVFLLNTGWTGGPFGVGQRIKLSYTRAMVDAALQGALDYVDSYIDPVFDVSVPLQIEGVPGDLMRPRETWADPIAYEAQARKLAALFEENFRTFQQ